MPKGIYYFLILGEHVVKDYLLPQNVYDFVVVDGLSADEAGVLIESESFLERNSDSVLQVSPLIKHGFSLLGSRKVTSLEPRGSLSW